MTISLTGRSKNIGMFGVAITTSSISVGSRCPHACAGVGAVATQNITDPHLATLVLNQMEDGYSAQEAINRVTTDQNFINYRQLTAIDHNGTTAHFTGTHILGTHAIHEAVDCVAAGNLLSSSTIPKAMTAGFNLNPETHLAERLILGLEAGIAAEG